MGLLQHARLCRKRLCRLATSRVGARVRLVLANETEPDEHAQAVGIGREQRMPAGKQQNLLGPGFSDARKTPERALRRRQRVLERWFKIAVKVLDHDARAVAELRGRSALQNAARGDAFEGLRAGGQDGGRARADRALELLERLATLPR